MATRKLLLVKSWFFVMMLALAPAALTGCRTSQAADKGFGGAPPGQGSTPTLLPAASVVPASSATKLAYGGQKTCPVTGDALGSMGAPIPVSLAGGQTIYVCCRGCANRVQRDPATYLRKVEAERNGS
ncbi:MAG: hypothetical protein HYX68_14875 [Planctomycetes bacterium]|nr:hypothetical protein [Planctomycetota bacterium]